MENNYSTVRKHLVYILNSALDISRKEHISSYDLFLFSKEVTLFKNSLDTSDIPNDLKLELKKIQFSYSSQKESFNNFISLIFISNIIEWLQQKHRTMLLNNFLIKYEKYLDLLANEPQISK